MTNSTQQLGSYGESLAAIYIRSKGYQILHRNWRFKKLEVDIIAIDKGVLVFIEVKFRSSLAFGTPESFVSLRKQQFLFRAAEAYIYFYNWKGAARFDVVAIYQPRNRGDESQVPQLNLIKDAFW
ncbi:YraN family protein [Sphingobacteriaceae bacterium WQ 2009]|uniref:UPF0102 protein J5U18_00910 n=1 Tax=Rhinopithecimicrobium faecis TaxID=2820698 RepID=A0A8T4H9I7_9SPHI|nr:YraN family protein [Sphingobacteriaceae bacterium WQ 2009]